MGCMKLDEYMKLKSVSDDDFASAIGKDRTSVSRYRNEKVTPPLDVIAKIDAETRGAVSFRDFLADANGEAA